MQHDRIRRILYIEDHADTRELVTLLLAQKSYEVITGSTIESGVSLATAGEFDLYLLDSWLPDGSGLDLCKQLGLTFDIVLDDGQRIASLYQLRGQPSSYLVAPDGVITQIYYGPTIRQSLEAAIAPFLPS